MYFQKCTIIQRLLEYMNRQVGLRQKSSESSIKELNETKKKFFISFNFIKIRLNRSIVRLSFFFQCNRLFSLVSMRTVKTYSIYET